MKPIESKEEQFNEIIFENRNKEYGAYALRASYKKRMLIALSVSLTAFLIAVSYPLIAAYLDDNPRPYIIDSLTYDPISIAPKDQPPLETPPPPPVKDKIEKPTFRPPVITNIEEPENVIFGNGEDVKNTPIDLTEVISATEEIPEVKEKILDIDDLSKVPFFSDEMPSYPGGENGWIKVIMDNIQYPILAKESNITGTVYLKFIVEPDGSITNITLLRGIGGGCDEEAIRVVKMLNNWSPGKQNGKAVRVWFTLPIKFTLE